MSDTDDTVMAWHFTGDRLRDGRPLPADGETLRHNGPLIMCQSGFHASVRLIDALQYAPGSIVWRVRCAVDIERDSDKLLCRERTGLWHCDATEVLGAGARQFALDVAHLWDMPPIVRRYLETGDETIRDAAEVATSTSAATKGATIPTRAAARAARAARNATRAAGNSGNTGNAAWAAVRDAAWAVACVRDAVWTVAWTVAWTAAWDAQNIRLTAMIEEGRPDV